METAKDKLILVKENKDQVIKALNRKLTEATNSLNQQIQQRTELERQLSTNDYHTRNLSSQQPT